MIAESNSEDVTEEAKGGGHGAAGEWAEIVRVCQILLLCLFTRLWLIPYN